MIQIKLDDACTTFSLYDSKGRFIGSSFLVGELLKHVALSYGIDVSFCKSESHMLAVLQEQIEIEVVEE